MKKQILEETSTNVETPAVIEAEQIVKEELPIDFFASFISKSWDEIGTLKATIEAVNKDFVNTEKVTEILQNLTDAYLICVGRLEAILHKNDYLEPQKEVTKDELEEVEETANETETVEQTVEDESEVPFEDEPFEESLVNSNTEEKPVHEAFEYFCDFDDIEL